MTQEIIPCPINEKDLCSDCMFDGLFDDDAHCWDGYGTLIGFVNRGVIKITYNQGDNEISMQMLDRPFNDTDLKQVGVWLDELQADKYTEEAVMTSKVIRKSDNVYTVKFYYILS